MSVDGSHCAVKCDSGTERNFIVCGVRLTLNQVVNAVTTVRGAANTVLGWVHTCNVTAYRNTVS
jgi:hypothetical protein